ncbi:MAG: CDP-diacylglycerol--glycerol-3-phosphate 3-phosphatidyltransferase, partial [Verrucomicrobiota bacterium]
MNLPNRLTIARLALTGLFVAVLHLPFPAPLTWAFFLFALAALTDFVDGYLARRYDLITPFGKLMDPVADKILTAAGFLVLVEFGLVPGWIVILILAREFLVTGLRLLAISQGSVLPADTLGKQKTIWQIATLLYFLLSLASLETTFRWMAPFFTGIGHPE